MRSMMELTRIRMRPTVGINLGPGSIRVGTCRMDCMMIKQRITAMIPTIPVIVFLLHFMITPLY